MKSTVIPAQVTTVEDTIAGNLTLTQIILLMMPLLFSTAIYALLPHKLEFTLYKLPLTALVSIVFLLLSLRIKGRLVLNWLLILAVYHFRPHVYVYSKNTLFSREAPVIVAEKKIETIKSSKTAKNQEEIKLPNVDYRALLQDIDLNIRFTRQGLVIAKTYE